MDISDVVATAIPLLKKRTATWGHSHDDEHASAWTEVGILDAPADTTSSQMEMSDEHDAEHASRHEHASVQTEVGILDVHGEMD
jgi:hypothetical protein